MATYLTTSTSNTVKATAPDVQIASVEAQKHEKFNGLDFKSYIVLQDHSRFGEIPERQPLYHS